MTALCHCEAQSAKAISRYNGAMTEKKPCNDRGERRNDKEKDRNDDKGGC